MPNFLSNINCPYSLFHVQFVRFVSGRTIVDKKKPRREARFKVVVHLNAPACERKLVKQKILQE